MPEPAASIKAYEAGSGHRILKGKTGTLYTGAHSSIIIAKAAEVGIDEHLWLCLQFVTEAVGVCAVINSIDTGVHVPGSRHMIGCAVDIDMMGADYTHLTKVTTRNRYAVMLVKWLLSQGWRNHEGGNFAGLMLGGAYTEYNATGLPHANHLHCSIARPPGSVEEATPDTPSGADSPA